MGAPLPSQSFSRAGRRPERCRPLPRHSERAGAGVMSPPGGRRSLPTACPHQPAARHRARSEDGCGDKEAAGRDGGRGAPGGAPRAVLRARAGWWQMFAAERSGAFLAAAAGRAGALGGRAGRDAPALHGGDFPPSAPEQLRLRNEEEARAAR